MKDTNNPILSYTMQLQLNQLTWLRKIAVREKKTMAKCVREAVDVYIKNFQDNPTLAEK